MAFPSSKSAVAAEAGEPVAVAVVVRALVVVGAAAVEEVGCNRPPSDTSPSKRQPDR